MLRRRDTVLEALEYFRGLNPNFWVSNLIVFLYVCENEGLNVKELAQVCRYNEATASRSLRSLAARGAPGALPPYMGLIDLFQNPADGRGRLIYLTEEGRRVRDEIDRIISERRQIVATVEAA
jgi:DNA-binding MarR family transcriptional regulator